MMLSRRLLIPAAGFWVALTVYGPAEAQISPGPLSAPHASLEGSDRCLKCHSQKQRVAADLCLDCHRLLGERIAAGRGYHARLADQGCERCHMEHHGREFDLVFWGEEGESGFDHGQTDFRLQGAHRDLSCRSCHKESLIRDPEALLRQEKDLHRTFLGLDGESCRSCHQDEHRGQFESRDCAECHGLVKWREEVKFGHESARFALRGQHAQVACEKCHRRVPDGGAEPATYVQYKPLEFAACTDCHRDPHTGRFGPNCTDCHSEQGWREVRLASFDHDRTRFALVGAHRRAACASCHPSGVSVSPPVFDRCSDCHVDHHRGQFAQRPVVADCSSCHDLESFSRPTFDLARHRESRYPLEGAHLAVPCDLCHVPLEGSPSGLRGRSLTVRSPVTAGVARTYAFSSTVCSACHRNPHESGIDRFMLESDCESCHRVASWRQIEFDHERTDYSLSAGHQRAGCLDCHRVEIGDSEAPVALRFDGTPQECLGCHVDHHAGQFETAEAGTVCTRCHQLDSWKNPRFDHQKDSRFSLDGVHLRVACRDCHPTETDGERTFVRYKPLGRECQDCHAQSRPRR